jgi:hypothetical protein
VLVSGSSGLVLRNLEPDNGTLVNGQAVTLCVLHDGDLLSFGLSQFQVHLPEESAAAVESALEPEKEALRIQAAAVAAQQAALTEEEIRLEQRRVALEQQEQQLAAHLEEKRRRLVNLRNEAREERGAVQQVRAAYEQRVAQIMSDLAQARRELADDQTQVQSERKHLLDLRQRMKHRFHRFWASERMAMRLREAEVAKRRRGWQKQSEGLAREKMDLIQAKLRLNGEMELGRRYLKAEWEKLRKEQTHLSESTAALLQREAILAQRERELTDEKRHWEQARFLLHQEAKGLETRIIHLRQKLLDQEKELNRLQGAVKSAAVPFAARKPFDVYRTAVLSLGFAWHEREEQLEIREAALRTRLSAVQQIAGELADQRLYLAEQSEHLARARLQWQQECDAIPLELEALGQRLLEREEALQVREQTVKTMEDELRRRSVEISRRQTHQEGCVARLAASKATWEGERNRLLASLRAREELVEQRLAALSELRERWSKRRQRQICRLRSQRNMCEKLRREAEALRQGWLRASTLLAQEQRATAERTLALEQYRQQWIARAAHPKAAEKRLERLRRRWATLAASAERALAKERKYLEARSACLEEQTRQLQRDTNELTAQEAESSTRQADWEQEQVRQQGEQDRIRRELLSLRDQRESYERQLESLREDVERLVRLMLGDTDPAPPHTVQAA